MNDWQKMDYHASNGEWDQALALASKLKHQGALAVLAGNFQIPPSHINSFLERMPRNDIPGTIYELSENLHPDLSSDDLHKIWKHVSGDYLTTKNIIEHPNFKGADAGQKAAGEFWNSYETKVNPSHFAAIKSALTGEPEFLETHRGIGHSSAHELQIPHLIKHMESSQQAILKDPTIPKQYVNGEPHIVVYRGVGGSYAKAIKNGLGIKDELNEGGPKSTIERHKTVNVPSTHMASWSIDKKMAVRFAGARGDHDSVGNPHHVIIKKLVPVRAVLHSGMHSLYPGHQPAHIEEEEVVLMHPSASYKVSSKDVEVGHPEKMGLVLPESFKPLEKKTAIKKSSDPLAPLIQQAKANLAAVHKVASQEPRPMLFGNKAGTSHGFVSLDPSKPNQWRVTHFVKGQPSGHTEAASFSDAIEKAHSYGYNVSKELSEEDMRKTQPMKKSEDFSRVSSVVVATDDKMLMLQRRDNNKWTFPGGHLNDTETHLEGAVRELWEEAGIRANPDEMILLGNKKTFQNKDIHVYLYKVNSEVKPSAANDPDKEAQKFAWLPHVLPEDIKENLYIPAGDNASLSMFSVWLLRQKTNKLKKLVESKKLI